MKKEKPNEHLIHFLDKTTPYQRMIWLKKAIEFWKIVVHTKLKKYEKLTK